MFAFESALYLSVWMINNNDILETQPFTRLQHKNSFSLEGRFYLISCSGWEVAQHELGLEIIIKILVHTALNISDVGKKPTTWNFTLLYCICDKGFLHLGKNQIVSVTLILGNTSQVNQKQSTTITCVHSSVQLSKW